MSDTQRPFPDPEQEPIHHVQHDPVVDAPGDATTQLAASQPEERPARRGLVGAVTRVADKIINVVGGNVVANMLTDGVLAAHGYQSPRARRRATEADARWEQWEMTHRLKEQERRYLADLRHLDVAGGPAEWTTYWDAVQRTRGAAAVRLGEQILDLTEQDLPGSGRKVAKLAAERSRALRQAGKAGTKLDKLRG